MYIIYSLNKDYYANVLIFNITAFDLYTNKFIDKLVMIQKLFQLCADYVAN